MFNRFWRNTRFEKHRPDPADPLNTDPPAPPAPPAPSIGGNVVCQGCGCKLARNGEVLSTGDRYKQFLKHDDQIAKKDREIEARDNEIVALKKQVADLQAQPRPAHNVGRKVG